MAKAIGIIGTIHGRSGNVVFSKGPNGSTVMKPYQPVVANPRTKGQVDQRAKVNAAGRFSRLWDKSTLIPLGGTPRDNRGKFNKNLIDNAKVTTAGAHINAEMVEFSNGAQPTVLQDLTVTATPATAGRSNITISGIVPAHTPETIARIYMAFIPSTISEKQASGVMISTAIPANNTDNDSTFSVSLRGISVVDDQDPDFNSRYELWAVTWNPTNDGGRQVYDKLVAILGDSGYITAPVEEVNATNGNFSKTAYIGGTVPPLAGE